MIRWVAYFRRFDVGMLVRLTHAHPPRRRESMPPNFVSAELRYVAGCKLQDLKRGWLPASGELHRDRTVAVP